MTPRQLVYETLNLTNKNHRAPRQLWTLGWANIHHGKEVEAIYRDYPDDIVSAPATYSEAGIASGNGYVVGTSVDAWGCIFENLQDGIHGQVKEVLVPPTDTEWEDTSRVHFPYEWLSFSVDEVNDFCKASDKFVNAVACPRPFEQLQFIRGTEELFLDLLAKPKGMMALLDKMHALYCDLMEKWAKTDVDALMFMDDWGAQHSLLISPALWREIFKPLYKDYVNIAHAKGKKIFMHSDGHMLEIIPDIIELGVDALNAQIFCMGVDNLAPYKGKITFWGEMDRQHTMPYGSMDDVYNAVKSVIDNLWANGGCIAQCEFGANTKPENVRAMFEAWDKILG